MEAVLSHRGLLVSVRNADEADAALAGGAALIDVKEPRRGALGRADDASIAAVVRTVGTRRPVSAALGELTEQSPLPRVPGLAFVKWGLAGVTADWQRALAAQMTRVAAALPGCRGVAVAYADWQRAAAPCPEDVAGFAVEHGCGAFLLDTWRKDGRTLIDWLSYERIDALCRRCVAAQVPVALAGALDAEKIQPLRSLAPHWFAVRGAACTAGRDSTVHEHCVRRLVEQLRPEKVYDSRRSREAINPLGASDGSPHPSA